MGVYLIDLDDTLIADVPAASAAMKATLAAVGLPVDAETTTTCMRIIRKTWKAHPHRHVGPLAQTSAWEALWLPHSGSGLPATVDASLRQHELQVWRAVLSAGGLAPEKAHIAAHTYRSSRAGRVRPLPGVRHSLTVLHRTHRLWLVTNGIPAHQRRKLTAAGLAVFFDRVFVSGEVGVPKSDPGFAATIRQLLHGSPVCQVVGDSVTQDLQLAINGGWSAAHVCRPELCANTESPAGITFTHVPGIRNVSCGC